MMQYMEAFASKFLEGRIQFNVQIQNVRRHPSGEGWLLDVQDLRSMAKETKEYARMVVCSGVRPLFVIQNRGVDTFIT